LAAPLARSRLQEIAAKRQITSYEGVRLRPSVASARAEQRSPTDRQLSPRRASLIYGMMVAMSEGTLNGSVEASAGSARQPPAARLRRLTIENFRNVRSTTLTFDDEWNVLLGKNGTGKTTLLELIAATLRGDLEALIALDPDVQLQAELSFGPATLTWLVERGKASEVPLAMAALQGVHFNRTERPERAFTVRVSGDGLLSYEKKGTKEGFDGQGGATFVTKADSEASFAFALVLGHRDSSGAPIWENKPLQRAIAAASRAADVIRFDELLTVFQNIGPEGKLSIMKTFGVVRGPFCSEELAKALEEAERANEQIEGGQISLCHEKLEFLGRFVELCGFEAGWLQLADLGRRRIAGKLAPEFGRPSFLFRRHNKEGKRSRPCLKGGFRSAPGHPWRGFALGLTPRPVRSRSTAHGGMAGRADRGARAQARRA
jgi:energy-coupling factor transporter ATP-binding protein EcfA2